MPRYRFADFILSPRRRILVRGDRELRLIPRYFDLLVFLVERRHEAVHRRDIFDRVWTDVMVSDSALSQAVRTLRRTLGDDSHEPIFIRTVSRHGYRFVCADVIEEEDDDARFEAPAAGPPATGAGDPYEPLLEKLTGRTANTEEEESQREAAERLHALGTAEALHRLGARPGHERARAILRDTRWVAPEAGEVPIAGQPGALATAVDLVGLRLRRVAGPAASRAFGAAAGAGLAGAAAGAFGGVVLAAAPASQAPLALAAVLAAIGVCCGALAGAGVGAGLSIGEAIARSWRVATVTAFATIGGTIVGSAVQWIGGVTLVALVGLRVPIGGALEGFVLGGASGIGYALATRWTTDGLAAPRGWSRARVVAFTALACAVAALALVAGGRALVGGTIHAIAQASSGAQAVLTPLGRLMGEPGFGPLTRIVIGTGEGAVFGVGLALGLTRRPRVKPE